MRGPRRYVPWRCSSSAPALGGAETTASPSERVLDTIGPDTIGNITPRQRYHRDHSEKMATRTTRIRDQSIKVAQVLYDSIIFNECYTILYYIILYHTIPYHTILYYNMLYCTILCCTILHYAILYYTLIYYTILYYTILYYTINK